MLDAVGEPRAPDWPFEDAFEFPNDMWSLIQVGRFEPIAVANFVRVMWFHFDYENGGLVQVMYNLKQARGERIEYYAQAFEELGLAPLATVIRLADKHIAVGENWQSVFGRPVEDRELDLVYHAIAYGMPGAYHTKLNFIEDNFEALHPSSASGEPARIDWVVRAALHYARQHRSAFDEFVEIYRRAVQREPASE